MKRIDSKGNCTQPLDQFTLKDGFHSFYLRNSNQKACKSCTCKHRISRPKCNKRK